MIFPDAPYSSATHVAWSSENGASFRRLGLRDEGILIFPDREDRRSHENEPLFKKNCHEFLVRFLYIRFPSKWARALPKFCLENKDKSLKPGLHGIGIQTYGMKSLTGGAFHDRSTKGLHHHNFDLDIILSIGLSRALKSMVPSRDLKGQRFSIYSLGHFC